MRDGRDTAQTPALAGAAGRQSPAVWWVVLVLASLIALYAMKYVAAGERMFPPQLADSFRARPWGIFPHAFFGAIALILGVFQFRRGLLQRRRALHRMLGKVYVASCFITGVAGLYMAAYSYGGWITHLGFGSLAVLLLFTTIRGWNAVRGGDIARHREWMLRSYALIFAAVTLRFELPLLAIGLGGFDSGYAAVSWMCWVPNLVWAEWYVRRSRAQGTILVQQLRTA